MKESQRKEPGGARAQHGYRNEVSWDEGQGGQPYTNQGAEEIGPGTAAEVEGGNRGDASGRTIEQLERLKQMPESPGRETPRGT